MFQDGMVFHCICAITWLGIPSKLADGPRSAKELAIRADVDADALGRVLRLLASHGIVAYDGTGTIALTAPGYLLSRRHPHSLASTFVTIGIHDVAYLLTETIVTGRSAAAAALGTGFWDYLMAHTAEQWVFGEAMAEQARLLTLPCVPLLDWSAADTIADVAGGDGTLLAAVLRETPEARGILIEIVPT